MPSLKQQYIEVSAAFNRQPDQFNHAAIAALYDLKALLEQQPRTRENAELLSSVCTLLCLHLSAWQAFKPFADMQNRKDVSRLYKLESNASWKKDKFALKDIRVLRRKHSPVLLTPDNFIPEEDTDRSYCLNCGVVVFNKVINDGEAVRITLWKQELAAVIPTITDIIYRLAEYPPEKLIAAYNNGECLKYVQEYMDKEANQEWFDTLGTPSVTFDCYGEKIITRIYTEDILVPALELEIEFTDSSLDEVTIKFC